MRNHYDLSKARSNPHVRLLERQVTLRLDESTLAYFKTLSRETAIPCQTLINLYLRECAATHKRLRIPWEPPDDPKA